jgi:hypothetical protein
MTMGVEELAVSITMVTSLGFGDDVVHFERVIGFKIQSTTSTFTPLSLK